MRHGLIQSKNDASGLVVAPMASPRCCLIPNSTKSANSLRMPIAIAQLVGPNPESNPSMAVMSDSLGWTGLGWAGPAVPGGLMDGLLN